MSPQLRTENPSALALSTTDRGRTAPCRLACWFDEDAPRRQTYTIRADGPWGHVEGAGWDGFGALLDARRRLEPLGWLLAVAGARRDAWPSGFLRESGGEEAYLLLPPAAGTELPALPILAPAPAHLAATAADQEAAHRRWLETPQAGIAAPARADAPTRRKWFAFRGPRAVESGTPTRGGAAR
ncbi:hypothetical protein ACFQ1I_42470 [Kitasatospora arboriphila]